MRRVPIRAALVVVAAGLFAVGVAFVGRGNAASDDVLGPGQVTVRLTIRHSHFDPDRIRVRAGTTVTFVIANADPIGHEFIVGDAAVHERHENGTEAKHDPRPGEVSIAALNTESTTFDFPAVDSVLFACHLPGHFRYGMSGYIDVVSS